MLFVFQMPGKDTALMWKVEKECGIIVFKKTLANQWSL